MVLDVLLVTVGLLGLVIAALSEKVRRMPLSEPLLALAAGVLLGDAVLGVLSFPALTADHTTLHTGAELLLAVSVMAVALRYPLSDVRRRLGPVTLLLLVAMPVMAVVSTWLGWLVLGVPLATAALLGAAMAATDPVLASSILTGDAAETDIPARNRQLLSIESGANDGLALPLVLVALAMAFPMTGAAAIGESLWQVLGAVGIGAVLGWAGGRALRSGEEHGATAHGPVLFYTVVLALAILGVAGLLRTDAILAVFVGGLAFNHVSTGQDRAAEFSIDEAVNRFAVLPLFVLLGAALPWQAWADLGWRGPALAVAILLLRRLPVVLLLARPLGLRWHDAVYLGWFGPVGVTALFYLTYGAERYDVPEVVLAAGSLVVVASTLVHGLTSAPGRALYRGVEQRRASR